MAINGQLRAGDIIKWNGYPLYGLVAKVNKETINILVYRFIAGEQGLGVLESIQLKKYPHSIQQLDIELTDLRLESLINVK